MGKSITLGGERLHSGQKMKVDLPGYERSTSNLNKVVRTTMSCGPLIPFYWNIALPEDSWDITIKAVVKTLPTTGPLFGSFKLHIDFFFAAFRLYCAPLMTNRTGIGLEMANAKLPMASFPVPEWNGLPKDINTAQVNQSSLIAYAGIRGFGSNDVEPSATRSFNGFPFIFYYDTVKNYYANKQEEQIAVIHTTNQALVNTVDDIEIDVVSTGTTETVPTFPAVPAAIDFFPGSTLRVNYTGASPIASQILINYKDINGFQLKPLSEICDLVSDTAGVQTYTGKLSLPGLVLVEFWSYRSIYDLPKAPPQIEMVPIENIDQLRNDILAAPQNVPFEVTSANYEPYVWLNGATNFIPNCLNSQEGLALGTYSSDINNNWLNSEWIDGTNGINKVTAVDVSGGELTIDALNLANRVYQMLIRVAMGDGTYKAWLETVYDYTAPMMSSIPMYMGGYITDVVFDEVFSTADAPDSAQPLGTLAGRGYNTKDRGGNVSFKINEPGMIMAIARLVPRIDYSQGNKWYMHLLTMDDLHKPALDQIGFQQLIAEDLAYWTTNWDGTKWVTQGVGFQPAWMNYRTDINETFGNFAYQNDEMFMTLNRRYQCSGTNSDMSDLTITDLTTYIDPSHYNYIFAKQSLDAQNFWTQIALDITKRSKMSTRIIPNL